VKKTGVDSLAISIGTSHGAYKFKPAQCTKDPKTGVLVPPPLRLISSKRLKNVFQGSDRASWGEFGGHGICGYDQ